MSARIAALWCAGCSLILFVLMGFDKANARKGAPRINEATLFAWAILGGAPGGWLGMHVFHHKTRHAAFRWGFFLLSILWIATLVWLYRR